MTFWDTSWDDSGINTVMGRSISIGNFADGLNFKMKSTHGKIITPWTGINIHAPNFKD